MVPKGIYEEILSSLEIWAPLLLSYNSAKRNVVVVRFVTEEFACTCRVHIICASIFRCTCPFSIPEGCVYKCKFNYMYGDELKKITAT